MLVTNYCQRVTPRSIKRARNVEICKIYLTMKLEGVVAAQPGVAADGALRRQDRSDFETWNQPDRLPDLVRRRR